MDITITIKASKFSNPKVFEAFKQLHEAVNENENENEKNKTTISPKQSNRKPRNETTIPNSIGNFIGLEDLIRKHNLKSASPEKRPKQSNKEESSNKNDEEKEYENIYSSAFNEENDIIDFDETKAVAADLFKKILKKSCKMTEQNDDTTNFVSTFGAVVMEEILKAENYT